MALDKVLKIYDENGNPVDYDILASDVKFLPDGKDLPTKLAEMEEEIGEGGYTPPVGGIPKADLASDVQTSLGKADTALQQSDKTQLQSAINSLQNALNTLIGSGNVQGAIDTFNEVKAFLDGIDTDDPTLANQLLTLKNAISAVQTSLAAKANSADVYSKSEVDTKVADAGKVKSVSVNGTKHTPDINGDVDLGNLRGQDGNSGVASADGVESVNNLNGGTTDTTSRVYVLGANQGKRLREQMELVYQRVQTFYGLLGNIAFWDGKPDASTILPALDWGNPKHAVTLSLNLTNAVVKHNGVAKANGDSIQVEEGGTLMLTIEPASGSYALTGEPTVSVGGNTVHPTPNSNGTYSVVITMGQSDIAVSIRAIGAAAYSISYSLAHIKSATRPTAILDGGTASITIEPEDGYLLAGDSIVVTGATKGTYVNNVLTISNPTGDVTISASAVGIGLMILRGYAMKRIGHDTANMEISNKAFVLNGVDQQPKFCVTDYIQVPQGDSFKEMYAIYGLSRNSTKYAGESDSIPACWALFNKESNGVFTLIDSWTTDGIYNHRSYTAAQFDASTVKTALLQALQAGTLYVRAFAMLTEDNGNTIDSSCSLKWGNDYLFRASQAYTLSDDPNDFEPFNLPS